MLKTYRYKLLPSRLQMSRLNTTLKLCAELYNVCLYQRKIGYRDWSRSVSVFDQMKQLPGLKSEFPEYKTVHSQVLQNVVHRCDKSFQSFFRRVETGEKPGFPRYKKPDWFATITYPQSGWKIEGNHVILSKIGTVKMKYHRKIPVNGAVKTVSITKDRCGDWFVCFSVDLPDPAPRKLDRSKSVGIDVGLEKFAVMSDGTYIKNPRHIRAAEDKLKRLHKLVSRKQHGSRNRKKAIEKLNRGYRKLIRRRIDYLHKHASKIVTKYDVIAFEKLNIKNLVRSNWLSKSIHDGSWNTFTSIVSYKAREAGKKIVFVDPKYTSQICSRCGTVTKHSLSERRFICKNSDSNCNFSIDRDLNAAVNIRNRAFADLGWGTPEVTLVETEPLRLVNLDASLVHEARSPCL